MTIPQVIRLIFPSEGVNRRSSHPDPEDRLSQLVAAPIAVSMTFAPVLKLACAS
jgi:hypothetical protein